MLFWWTITEGGLTVRQLTLFFSTFVFLQFWNMFNAKGFETRHSVFTCLRGCREFFLILLAIAAGQVLIVEFGGEVFRTEPLAWRAAGYRRRSGPRSAAETLEGCPRRSLPPFPSHLQTDAGRGA